MEENKTILDSKHLKQVYNSLYKNQINTLNHKFSISIQKMESARDEYSIQNTFQQYIHYDVISDYKRIIKSTAEIVREIGLSDNSISYSIIIAKLIHQKYLSYNNKFQISYDPFLQKNIGRYFGIDIINGFGCCRHMCGIAEDIFLQLGLHNSIMPCFSPPDDMSPSKKIAKKNANHTVNLIDYKGSYYAYDTSHELFYKFENGIVLTPYQNYLSADSNLYYKPLGDIVLNNLSKDNVTRKVNLLHEYSKKEVITYQEFYEILLTTNNQYNNSTAALEEFNSDIKYYKKRIVSNL